MTFGEALEIVKARGYAQRAGWGDGFIMKLRRRNTAVTQFSPYSHGARAAGYRGPRIQINAHIDRYLGEAVWQPGWTPTQEDMFADDWQRLPGSVRPETVMDVDVGDVEWTEQD